jgi:transcriptional regulator with XRE-family HTH domain
METTAERLKAARMRQVLSQRDLAEKAGVPIVTISRIENGHNTPIPATVRKLAEALDVDPAWLMYGDSEEAKIAA